MLDNLRKLRIEMKISQGKLGQAIGVSQQTINKYENHNIEPDIHTLMMLADYFDTSIDYLVGYSDVRNLACGEGSVSLSKRETELVSAFRMLNPSEKESIELIMKNYLNNSRR